MKASTPRQLIYTLFILAGLLPGSALAASFYINTHSAAGMGNAFSGQTAIADDASVNFFNPALLSRLEGQNLSVGAHWIAPEAEFSDSGSSNPGQPPGSLEGSDGKTDKTAVVPNLYYSLPIDDQWTFGLGINAPFGLETEYDDDWVGRYHALGTDVRILNINPNLAFRVNDQFSVGFGINYQRSDATLSNAVDSVAACVGARQQEAGQSQGDAVNDCTDDFQTGFGDQSIDSKAEISGDDDAFGINLGLHYEMLDGTLVGLSWRQGVSHTLEGDVSFDRSDECADDSFCSGATEDGDIEADLELPDIVSLSVAHPVSDQLTGMFDISWFRWSQLEEIRVERDDGSELDTLEFDYSNTFRVAMGGQYELSPEWTLRAGLAFDQAPQTSSNRISPRFPDGNRRILGMGARYSWDQLSVDMAYTHINMSSVSVTNTNNQGHTLDGNFDPEANVVSAQLNWQF